MKDINKRTMKEYREMFPDASRRLIGAFNRLMSIADDEGCLVRILPLKGYRGLILGNRIGLSDRAMAGQMLFDLSHELGHHLDRDCGNIIDLPKDDEYRKYREENADRTACVLLKCLGFSGDQIEEWKRRTGYSVATVI